MEDGRIPNNLRRYRRIAGLSQKRVATKLGLSQTSCISRWEHGVSVPSVEMLFKLGVLYHTMPHLLYSEIWHRKQLELNTISKVETEDEAIHNNTTFFV